MSSGLTGFGVAAAGLFLDFAFASFFDGVEATAGFVAAFLFNSGCGDLTFAVFFAGDGAAAGFVSVFWFTLGCAAGAACAVAGVTFVAAGLLVCGVAGSGFGSGFFSGIAAGAPGCDGGGTGVNNPESSASETGAGARG